MSVRDNTLIIFCVDSALEWKEKVREEEYFCTGHGFVCEGNIIITNYHVISLCKNIYTDYGELEVLKKSYNNDIAILKFKDNDVFDNFPNPIPINSFNQNIPKKYDEINFIEIDEDKQNIHNLYVENVSYDNNKIYINCDYKEKANGLSGGPCFNNNNEVVGIITQYNTENNLLQIYPIIYVLQLLKSDNFYTLPSNVDKYNILYINDEKVINGLVYSQNIQFNIDIYTYTILNYSNQKIKLTIQQKKKIKDVYIDVIPIDYNTYIPFFFNEKYIKYNNIIFVEISKEIMEYYKLVGPFFKYLFLDNKKNKKIVVPIENKSNLELNNLFSNDSKFVRVSTIYKINNKKISNLDDMNKIILKNKKSELKIEYEYDINKYETIKF